MHYFIYFPGATAPDPRLFERNNIQGLLRGGNPDMAQTRCGPDGKHGIIATWGWGSGGSPVLADTEDKTWRRFEVDGEPLGWMLGWVTDSPPEPADLELDDSLKIDGSYIKLGDGNEWLVPESQYVPREHKYDSRAKSWTIGAPAEFEEFCRKAEQYAIDVLGAILELGRAYEFGKEHDISFSEEKPVEFSLQGLIGFVVESLSINYRLTPEIVSEFGLLDTPSITRAIHAIAGQHEKSFMRIVKKNYNEDIISIPIGLSSAAG